MLRNAALLPRLVPVLSSRWKSFDETASTAASGLNLRDFSHNDPKALQGHCVLLCTIKYQGTDGDLRLEIKIPPTHISFSLLL